MRIIVLAMPLLPGKSESWRRVVQEMQTFRLAEYQASRQKYGIHREQIWLVPIGTMEISIILLFLKEADQMDITIKALAGAEQPFDVWFNQQIRELGQFKLFPDGLGELLGDCNFEQQFQEKEQISMTLESNKALVRRIYQAMQEGNLAAVDELFQPDFVNHDPALPPLPKGSEGYKVLIQLLRTGFPDMKLEIEDLIAEKDLVTARWNFSGTHLGEFANVPATRKSIKVGGTVIHRFENGKSAEHWAIWDILGLLTQLGAVPAKA